jgi:hypothetical protein
MAGAYCECFAFAMGKAAFFYIIRMRGTGLVDVPFLF